MMNEDEAYAKNEALARKRPTSPDFWALSEIIIGLDKAIGVDGEDLEDIVAAEVDLETLYYVSMQRAMRMPGARDRQELHKTISQGSALWIEAFMMGIRFERHRAQDDSSTEWRQKLHQMQVVEEVAIVAAVQFQRRLKIIAALLTMRVTDWEDVIAIVFALCEAPSIEEWLQGLRKDAIDGIPIVDDVLQVAEKVYNETREDEDVVRSQTPNA